MPHPLLVDEDDVPLGPLEEVLDRLLVIEEEAFPTADCIPYFFHFQDAFPYFTHRIGDLSLEQLSSQYSVDSYTIIVRIVVAHLLEGYDGESEVKIANILPKLVRAFIGKRWLRSDVYPEGMVGLSPNGIQLQQIRGLSVFDDGGFGSESQGIRQVGTEVTLLIPFIDDIEED